MEKGSAYNKQENTMQLLSYCSIRFNFYGISLFNVCPKMTLIFN